MISIDRIKLLRSLSISKNDQPNLPPFGISVITSYLRQRGFFIVQDDLNAKCFSPYSTSPSNFDRYHLRRIMQNRKRLLDHLTGGSDAELTSIAEHVISKACCRGFDAILLSVFPADDCCSLFSMLIAKYLKDKFQPLIVVGGEYNQCALINEMFGNFHSAGIVDYYIDGYGEESLYQLFTFLRNGSSLEGVRGLVYSDNGKVRRNEPDNAGLRPIVFPEFEGLPLDLYRWKPDRTLLRIIESHNSKLNHRTRFPSEILMLPFQLLTVCHNRCAFCAQSGTFPSKSSILPPDTAVAQLKLLVERFGIKHFFFLDDTVNISKWYIQKICDEIIKNDLDILWSDCVSARNMDKETLWKMKAAGAMRVVIGLESASVRMLKHIDKKVTPDMVSNVLRWAHDIGIITNIEIIAGLPTENDEDIKATIDFLNLNKKNIDEVHLNHFYLERNSLMFKFPQQYGIKNVRVARRSMTEKESFFPLQQNFFFSFDEINGLRWEGKKKQIHESFERIDDARFKLGFVPARTDYGVSMLFYLFTIFDDYQIIREIYSKYKKRDIMKRIFDVSNIVSNLRDVQSVDALKDRIKMLKWKSKKALHVSSRLFRS